MVSTVYKGDLAEVTFGHECGIVIAHGNANGIEMDITTSGDISTITFHSGNANGMATVAITTAGTGHVNGNVITMPAQRGGTPVQITATTTAVGAITVANVAVAGTRIAVGDVLTQVDASASTGPGIDFVATVLTVDNADAATEESFFFSQQGSLRYPAGMLVGSQLRVIGGANYSNDDFATKGHVYTIVANSQNTIQVSPAMKSTGVSAGGDELMIDTIATPTIDTGMAYHTNASASDETVLTDQFIGLAATIGLPETKVEIRRSHVIGIGRDVVIQEPQSMKNEGGSMEMMMNSARWLYYALGSQVINEPAAVKATIADGGSYAEKDIAAGDTYYAYTGTATGAPVVGEYLLIVDGTAVDFPRDNPAAASKKWGANGVGTDMENAERNEIRRVVAVDNTLTERRIHVDEPFSFDHAIANMSQKVLAFHASSTGGSPHFDATASTFGTITNRQSRLIYQGATVPSFTLESSIRTRNVGSFNASGEAEAAPGSASDSKQLTRIWRGCKVKDFSIAADADAEVKLSVNFDALYCYTDTGRLENNNKGDRYTAHRMFENTANSVINRKKAGIAPNTEKPYFFYNGSITAFGINLAQITNFSLSGNNNIENIMTVRGSSLAEARNSLGQSLEQVPFGGSRNPSLTVEKQVEYDCSLTLIVSDPLLWHEYRTNRSHGSDEPITLTLTKAGAGANREEVIIVIDDYIISEAPLPIPEDKGVIKSEIKIMPKHVRVISHDAFLGL